MKLQIYLIRHGLTAGNLEKRYIGRTDEPLCEEGRARILKNISSYPKLDHIYVSPKKRCMQTANLIYPGQEMKILEDFSECDFGLFEGKNYLELSACSQYQAWIDSGGTLPFPEGEDGNEFRRRSLRGFEKMIQECEFHGIQKVAAIVHGGTIMSIMEAYGYPKADYYDYQIKNGDGYELVIETNGSCGSRILSGSDFRGSGMDVSSSAADRDIDLFGGKNYKRLLSEE